MINIYPQRLYSKAQHAGLISEGGNMNKIIALILFGLCGIANASTLTCVGDGGTGTDQSFTAGSVVFAGSAVGPCGATGNYTQSNINLNYDSTNNILTSNFNKNVKTATAARGSATAIPATSGFETIISTGLGLLMAATPTISTSAADGITGIPDGTYMMITSTASQTITLQDNGTLSGSLLELGAATRAITAKKRLLLQFEAATSSWMEVSYGNN